MVKLSGIYVTWTGMSFEMLCYSVPIVVLLHGMIFSLSIAYVSNVLCGLSFVIPWIATGDSGRTVWLWRQKLVSKKLVHYAMELYAQLDRWHVHIANQRAMHANVFAGNIVALALGHKNGHTHLKSQSRLLRSHELIVEFSDKLYKRWKMLYASP